MRKAFLLGIIMAVISCAKKEVPLIGIWEVDSKFYKATCEILEEKNEVKGVVLYYNDDTTVYKYEEGQPKNYFFNNLKEKNDLFVDALAGATNTKNSENNITLNLLSKDTLEVTSYILHKPLKEIWIRN